MLFFASGLLDQVTALTLIFMNGGIKHNLSSCGGIFKVKCLYCIILHCFLLLIFVHTHTQTRMDIYEYILISMVFKCTNDVISFVKLDNYFSIGQLLDNTYKEINL